MPKGFGKNYFTLAAIQMVSSEQKLSTIASNVNESHTFISLARDLDEPLDIDELSSLEEFSLSKPSRALHCNCYYKKITKNLIENYPQQQLNILTYKFTNSVSSPPI